MNFKFRINIFLMSKSSTKKTTLPGLGFMRRTFLLDKNVRFMGHKFSIIAIYMV